MSSTHASLECARREIETLKSSCLLVSEAPSPGNVENLKGIISNFDPTVLDHIQKFVIFPHVIALTQSRDSGQELHLAICESLANVLCKVKVAELDTFLNVFNCLMCLLSPPQALGKVAQKSEELTSSVLTCLLNLLRNTSFPVLTLVYMPKNLPIVGHSVSTLLHIAENEKLRSLKVTAMDSLLELSQAKSKDEDLTRQSGSIFASFLPGVAMSLCKIATSDSKHGQAVIQKALLVWSSIVSLVLNDTQLNSSTNISKANEKYQELVVQRTDKWVETTSAKLHVLVQKIAEVVHSDHWKVCLAVAQWAECLLVNCFVSLKQSVPVFVEVLVALSCDDYSQVADKSSEVLNKLLHDPTKGPTLTDAMDDSLSSLVISLPRIVRSNDDVQKLTKLRHFRGLIKFMGDRVDTMPHTHLNKMLMSITQLLEMDCADIKVLEERLTSTNERIEAHSLQTLSKPKKHFKHFKYPQILVEIQAICQTLTHHVDLATSIESLLDLFLQSSVHYKQSVLVINDMLLGAVGNVEMNSTQTNISDDVLESLVRLLVSEFTNKIKTLSSRLQPHLEADPHEQPLSLVISKQTLGGDITLSSTKNDIWTICLLLESFGVFSQILKDRLNNMLMEFLYVILEMVGQESAFISITAYLSLQEICKNCGYANIGELICRNADYLLSTLSLHLRYVERHPSAPVVLNVILQYSDVSVLNIIHQTVQDLLMALDTCNDSFKSPILNVLCTLVTCLIRWFAVPEKEVEKEVSTNTSDIADYFREYHKAKQLAEGDFSDDLDLDDVTDGAQEIDDENSPEDENAKPPYHITLLTEVLERCRHYVSSSNPRTRLMVLDLIASGCKALKSYEKELLPMIHKLWPSLVERFHDNDLVVVLRTFKTFEAMTVLSGSFIRNRSVKDVLPKIGDFLKTQAKISCRGSHNYLHTIAYKLQLGILNGIGEICEHLEIMEMGLYDLAICCLPYLSGKQPTMLQQACMKTFAYFIEIEPDAMWLLLADVHYDKELLPPGDGFKSMNIGGSSDANVEYATNVRSLLKLCEQ